MRLNEATNSQAWRKSEKSSVFQAVPGFVRG